MRIQNIIVKFGGFCRKIERDSESVAKISEIYMKCVYLVRDPETVSHSLYITELNL